MRKPTAKWDTSLGLDYSGSYKSPKYSVYPNMTFTPHNFPPFFINTKLISQSALDGRGDTFQLVKHGNYIYICHLFSSGFSVVDVKDPTKPEVVNFISTGNPHSWNIKCRVLGNILIVTEDWKFFEPVKYTIRAEEIAKGDRSHAGHEDNGPKDPLQAGIKIYDVSRP
ncbi:MAG: hypothetical protein ACFFDC_20725, partial [Promethearchaeota archaeon]